VEGLTVAYLLGALKAVVAVVSVFVVSIVLHEFGHFIVAKKCGVAVPAFALGFGPKLFRWVRGGTEYSIRLFPIGGLVQLAGEIPQDALFRKGEEIAFELNSRHQIQVLGDPLDVPHGKVGTLVDLDLMDRLQMTIDTGDVVETYRIVPHARLMTSARNSMPLVEKHEQVMGKPLWQRAAMILAGPLMNFLLAGVIFSIVFSHQGVPVNSPTLGGIVVGSPAQAAGLMAGDKVMSVNGQPISSWTQFVEEIRGDTTLPPHPLQINLVRDGHVQQVAVTPSLSGKTPQLGIEQPVTYNPGKAVLSGFHAVYDNSVGALQMYAHIIRYHQFDNLAGPVGIADVIGHQAQSGLWNVIMIAGFLSLNLGLFNLLPIPALDGGRLLFMIVEMFRGKSVDPRKEGLVHFVGFALLMLFAVVITYRDVTRLF
jgi:regulator of sigma E protease